MWIHIFVFIILFLVYLGWKIKIFPDGILKNTQGRKYFFIVAIVGNLLGLLLSMSSGKETIYKSGHQIAREDSSFKQEFQVLGEEGEEIQIQIKIPEKPSEEEDTIVDTEESEEENYRKKVLAAVKKYNEIKNDPEYFYLPESLEGEKLQWKTVKDTKGILITVLFLVAAIALMIQKEKEDMQQLLKRHEEMLMDYPGVIMKFTLLIQAGMTARKAFLKIGYDYKYKKGHKEKQAYEEILKLCNEMETGVSEMEAYRRFGERCGQVKYKTFSTLLIQNLQKGGRHLADMLENESVEAWDERKRKARVLGETAATKLIIPMILMLAIVMAIIMIPACMSFYGGV